MTGFSKNLAAGQSRYIMGSKMWVLVSSSLVNPLTMITGMRAVSGSSLSLWARLKPSVS